MIFIVVEELEGELHSVSELVGWLGLWKLDRSGGKGEVEEPPPCLQLAR
jgi:hypothetical protein